MHRGSQNSSTEHSGSDLSESKWLVKAEVVESGSHSMGRLVFETHCCSERTYDPNFDRRA